VRQTLQAHKGLTRDLGGDGSTASLTEQLIHHLPSSTEESARDMDPAGPAGRENTRVTE
jgi:hypothetical protein